MSATDPSGTTTLALPSLASLAVASGVLPPRVGVVSLDGLPFRVSRLAP